MAYVVLATRRNTNHKQLQMWTLITWHSDYSNLARLEMLSAVPEMKSVTKAQMAILTCGAKGNTAMSNHIG